MCEIKVRVGALAFFFASCHGFLGLSCGFRGPRTLVPRHASHVHVSGDSAEAYQIPENRVVFVFQRLGGDSLAFNSLWLPQTGETLSNLALRAS